MLLLLWSPFVTCCFCNLCACDVSAFCSPLLFSSRQPREMKGRIHSSHLSVIEEREILQKMPHNLMNETYACLPAVCDEREESDRRGERGRDNVQFSWEKGNQKSRRQTEKGHRHKREERMRNIVEWKCLAELFG